MVPGAAKAPDLAGKGDPVSEGPLLDVARNRSESSSACKEGYRLVDGFWPLTGVQPSQKARARSRGGLGSLKGL